MKWSKIILQKYPCGLGLRLDKWTQSLTLGASIGWLKPIGWCSTCHTWTSLGGCGLSTQGGLAGLPFSHNGASGSTRTDQPTTPQDETHYLGGCSRLLPLQWQLPFVSTLVRQLFVEARRSVSQEDEHFLLEAEVTPA